MAIVRWDPFRPMTRWPSVFDEMEVETSIPVDIDETDEAVLVTASVPGIEPENVDITVTRDTLTIKGKSEKKTEEKTKTSYRKEIEYGEFSRVISWPTSIDTEKVEAEFNNGILRVTAPKAEEVKPKSIKITAKNK